MDITLTINTDDLSTSDMEHLLALIRAGSGTTEDQPDNVIDDEELEAIAQEMYDEGLKCEPEVYFRTPELFKKARPSESWNNLPSNARKVLGRRFRKLTEMLQDEASTGDLIVRFAHKTLQNAALYQLAEKE